MTRHIYFFLDFLNFFLSLYLHWQIISDDHKYNPNQWLPLFFLDALV